MFLNHVKKKFLLGIVAIFDCVIMHAVHIYIKICIRLGQDLSI